MLAAFNGSQITTWQKLMKLYDPQRNVSLNYDYGDHAYSGQDRPSVENMIESVHGEIRMQMGQGYLQRHFESPEDATSEYYQHQ